MIHSQALRLRDDPIAPPSPAAHTPVPSQITGFAAALLRDRLVTSDDMVRALALTASGGHLGDTLIACGALDENTYYQRLAIHSGCGLADLGHLPDARLIDRLGAATCLRHKIIPWRTVGDATVIVAAYPDEFDQIRELVAKVFGRLILAIAPPRQIEGALLSLRGNSLVSRAESCVADADSCRGFRAETLRGPIFLTVLFLLVAALLAPVGTLVTLTALAVLCMFGFSALKLAAWITPKPPLPEHPPPTEDLPQVSVMVALYRESNIAPRLIKRLGTLDYPRDLLEILLVVEADDHQTRAALSAAALPPWMRVVSVPRGRVKTKPRALNYALDHCRGTIIGVYDAEDAPEPAQIRRVVSQFAVGPPDLACVQGMLDFYNPRTNWLSRCFTVEYAAWFRQFLPGLERLGMVVPLGGTTLFFRRSHLEQVGRWDAHNVTEDADLGLRLARHGLRTEVIATVTYEEANCRTIPWIKQRSRWSKGFMMTWLTHMRTPRRLWHDLGPKRFMGVQVLLLGSVLQNLLAPLLWTFWLIPFGLPHPVATALGEAGFTLLYSTFFATTALTLLFDAVGLRKTRHGLSPLWVPSLIAYHMLATFAAYKALWELLTKPFYWDKTSHGLFD